MVMVSIRRCDKYEKCSKCDNSCTKVNFASSSFRNAFLYCFWARTLCPAEVLGVVCRGGEAGDCNPLLLALLLWLLLLRLAFFSFSSNVRTLCCHLSISCRRLFTIATPEVAAGVFAAVPVPVPVPVVAVEGPWTGVFEAAEAVVEEPLPLQAATWAAK